MSILVTYRDIYYDNYAGGYFRNHISKLVRKIDDKTTIKELISNIHCTLYDDLHKMHSF